MRIPNIPTPCLDLSSDNISVSSSTNNSRQSPPLRGSGGAREGRQQQQLQQQHQSPPGRAQILEIYPEQNLTQPSQTQTRPTQKTIPDKSSSESRRTKIQVCVRIRPVLPYDKKHNLQSKQSPSKQSPQKLAGRRTTITVKGGGSNNRSNNNNSNKLSSNDSSNSSASTETQQPSWSVSPDHRSISQALSTNPDHTRTNTYKFDHCFDPTQSTLDLYTDTVKDSVRAFMEGYHTSVFAYGQTATGKTFTMTGNTKANNKQDNHQDNNSRGIVQLSIQDCFDYIHNEKAEGREYLLRVSFMEIYNEVVNDLLVDQSSSPTHTKTPNNSAHNTPTRNNSKSPAPLPAASTIRIFESKREGVVIRGLKEEIVTSYSEVLSLLASGEARRQTGSTQLNKQSSRSHSIFRLTVESRQRAASKKTLDSQASGGSAGSTDDSIASGAFCGKSSGPVRVSTLSLVDLAGSESVKNTGSTGTRQKEGQYINKSLLTLGHVVWKLAELSKGKGDGEVNNLDTTHIPYRDSKLTRLLQPSLSGRAQIVLICNISPIIKHLEESHNTLKFASRAKRIKQNAIVTEVSNDKTLLQNYREEIDDLKRQLKDAKGPKSSGEKSGGGSGSSVNGGRGRRNTGDEEEMGIIVQAIHNLERLILTTTTATERKKKKKRKTNKYREDNLLLLDVESEKNGNGHVHRGVLNGVIEAMNPAISFGSNISEGEDDEDTLLGMLNEKSGDDKFEENLLDMSLVSRTTTRSSSIISKDEYSLTSKTDMSLGDDTIVEGKKLISELQRVQGLLGTVLMRKTTPTKTENGMIVRDNQVDPTKIATTTLALRNTGASPLPLVHTQQSSLLLLKNEEVERLRGQLHQQAVATSLRQADSSFLQSQLQEKDILLKEVSKILESVERRQIQLEKENVGWKEDWAKSVANLRAKESECEKTVKLLKARESEIQQLRRQLEGTR